MFNHIDNMPPLHLTVANMTEDFEEQISTLRKKLETCETFLEACEDKHKDILRNLFSFEDFQKTLPSQSEGYEEIAKMIDNLAKMFEDSLVVLDKYDTEIYSLRCEIEDLERKIEELNK